MTHEATPATEADEGPEATADLPDATSVPVADEPDALPPIDWADDPAENVIEGERIAPRDGYLGLDVQEGDTL
jgi:hypothetical protein